MKKEYNVVFYYIYPLVHNAAKFGYIKPFISHFLDCFICSNDLIIVFNKQFENKDINEDALIDCYLCSNSVNDLWYEDNNIYVSIPIHQFLFSDVELFKLGKYSEFSSKSKEEILSFVKHILHSDDLMRVVGVLSKSNIYASKIAKDFNVDIEVLGELEQKPRYGKEIKESYCEI